MTVLLVIHVIIAGALIGAVLLQRSDTDGFGLSGGSGMNLLSGRASANLLTRTTAILAALFILNSLALDIMAAHMSKPSILQTIEQEGTATDTAAPLAAGTDEATKATEIGVNRDAAVDTNKAAVQATQEKTETQAPAVPTPAEKSAPAVPTAQ